eukprot:gene20030-26007_t
MKSREEGFNLRNLESIKRQEYNALFDPNMRHFFENQKIQTHLFKTGQIDRHGRVVDLLKNKSKVQILEREFKEAQKIEERRLNEELEMRYRVQRKRFNDLEYIRKQEILQKLRSDREISKEIVSILKSTTVPINKTISSDILKSVQSRSPLRTSESIRNAGFFLTDK